MDEKQALLLSQYDVDIYRAMRMKGAWLLETDKGLKLFGTCPFGESKLAFEQKIKQQAKEQGFAAVDSYVKTKDGTYLVAGPYNEFFVMRDWFIGEECDVQCTEHVLEAVTTLAKLHLCLTGLTLAPEEDAFSKQAKLPELLERRNRELRRVRSYIRSKKQKSAFEQKFLSRFSLQYEQAEEAVGWLSEAEYEEDYQEALSRGTVAHGNFTHHSVILSEDGTAVTGFQKAAVGMQVQDLYLLFRKMMEKREWDADFGKAMLSAYESIKPLTDRERKWMKVMLFYPEKFWKVANQYYNNRKSWIPEKNMQKLIQTMEQAEKKEECIRRLFT